MAIHNSQHITSEIKPYTQGFSPSGDQFRQPLPENMTVSVKDKAMDLGSLDGISRFSEAGSSQSSSSDAGSSQQGSTLSGHPRTASRPRWTGSSAVSAILEATRISKASRALQLRLAMASHRAKHGDQPITSIAPSQANITSPNSLKRSHSTINGGTQLALTSRADGSAGTELVLQSAAIAEPETPEMSREDRMVMSTSRRRDKHRAKYAARRAITGQGRHSSPLGGSDYPYRDFGWPGAPPTATLPTSRDVESVGAATALTSMVGASGAGGTESRPRTVTQELIMSGYGHIPATPPRVSASRHDTVGASTSRKGLIPLNVDTKTQGQEDDAAQLMLYFAASPSPARSRQSSFAGGHIGHTTFGAADLSESINMRELHDKANGIQGPYSRPGSPKPKEDLESRNQEKGHINGSKATDQAAKSSSKTSTEHSSLSSFHSEHHPVTPSRGVNVFSAGYTPLGLGWHTGMTPEAAALHAGRDRDRESGQLGEFASTTPSPTSAKSMRREGHLTTVWPTRRKINFDEISGSLSPFAEDSSSRDSSQNSQSDKTQESGATNRAAPLPARRASIRASTGGPAIRSALLPPMGPPQGRHGGASSGLHESAEMGYTGMSSPVKGLSLE